MTLPAWVGIAIAVLAVALIIFLVVRAWRASIIPWQPMPNYYPGARLYLVPGAATTPARVVACLQKAQSCLNEATHWTAAQMGVLGPKVCVFVKADEVWTDDWQRRVAGAEIGYILEVGASCSALCHELAHLAQAVLDNVVDENHSTWATNGIAQAVAAYVAWQQATAQEAAK